ncbi:hypothetical protein VTK56DRAFT_1265 [Thermocarpiscus australiensis]
MPKPAAPLASGRPPKRDFELCKVVFGAVISQILYARRAFPPKCFQLLPLDQIISKSFADILTSGTSIQLHDRELLRDQRNTVFLRQCGDYSLTRFLGILTSDIFPLIETESLVKFRINYLRKNAWNGISLEEYYTVTFKYATDGKYGMDIWRAGTGRQHVSTSDSKLWNLGAYLSRLPTWTEPTHWTLAFHATERLDNPTIGIWKFDRTDFDEANLALQQQNEYNFCLVVNFDIMPPASRGVNEEVLELILEPEPGSLAISSYEQPQSRIPRSKAPSRARRNQKAAQEHEPSANVRTSDSRGRGESGVSRKAQPKKRGPIAKRKPKPPLQVFEDVGSSLAETQWVPRASPPDNVLGIALSDEEDGMECASDAEPATLSRAPVGPEMEPQFTYDFSPNTVARRESLFQEIISDSGNEE